MTEHPLRLPSRRLILALGLTALACSGGPAGSQDRPDPAPAIVSRPQVIQGPWYWRNAKGEIQGGLVDRLDSEGIIWRETEDAKPARIRWTEVEELRRNADSSIDASQDSSLGPMVLLPDRDKVRGEAVATLTQGLAIQSASIGVVNLPLAQWAGFLSLPPESPVAFLRTIDQLRRGSDTPGDLVLLANGDRMQGTVIELDADNLKVQPTGAAKPITLPRKGIQGVAIDASTLSYPPVDGIGWKVSLTDGSRISAKSLSFDPSDPESGLNVTTRWGSEWRVPMNKLAGMRVIHPGMVELDTIKPAAIQTVDYVGPTESPRFGANVSGGPLKLGTRTFDQGIGTQSRTLIAYRLDGTKKTFTAWVGLENAAGPKGQARAVVLLDGKPVYDSGPLKAGEMPRRVQVELGNSKLLILASEFGEGGGVRDWVNWCDPVLRP
ncbi:hypothetical protein GC170_14200 [bacterium]|nr:hypothetical protein [bacterium]